MNKTREKNLNPSDLKDIRLRSLKRFLGLMFFVTVYFSFCISGLFKVNLNIENAKEMVMYCLSHPFACYNKKTLPTVMLGLIVWIVGSLSAYNKRNLNLIHGLEYGSAKWGDRIKFNAKYAKVTADSDIKAVRDKSTGKFIGGLSEANKVLSNNIRFRYDSSTLRNNNIIAVGGSGAGKTSFFLTPNLLSMHDCNIYTDPKGGLLEEFGAFLASQKDTRVYSLNMCEMEKSMHFNPFLYIRKRSDIGKLISNLIQNTTNQNIKNSSADPFWERAEKMFLESIFLYVWMEAPFGIYNKSTGKGEVMFMDWRTVLFLIDEAAFAGKDSKAPLDIRMERLQKKDPNHPAAKAYFKYRNGPEDTVRSVLMTVNARMQPFDNPDLLKIFCDNEIPLDEFGSGVDGDGKTKSNLFIVIPDDDDTYNFVPGIVYTLLFQELYRQARFFDGKLPMDVGLWMDEFANIKTPANFDKILATCRSRGIYCVPIFQSLAQLKTLFADGAWEGIIGNCDTFLYLGGNEASTYEYISKLLGKWTIDKRTNGESKGGSGSYSENFDVLGRELMMEYELRLLPDDECIIFVRGEEPIRDKKWYPWEHLEYEKAKKYGNFNVDKNRYLLENHMPGAGMENDQISFIGEDSTEYIRKQGELNGNVRIYEMDAYDFMMLDVEKLELDRGSRDFSGVDAEILQEYAVKKKQMEYEERFEEFRNKFDDMRLLDIYASDLLGEVRRNVLLELKKNGYDPEDIKSVIHPGLKEEEVMAKKRALEKMG